MNGEHIIKATNLTKNFGSFTAVDQITFSVKKGEIFGFLGANGAGKTTAMKMLSGLLKPSSGSATVAGFDVYKEAEKIKKRIGYMSQRFSLYEDLTISENIKFYGGIYRLSRNEIKAKGQALIRDLNLDAVKNKLVAGLPLGWKQKLAFSIAILHNPEIVFLDEPTGGVDPITRRQFWEMIYEAGSRGITVFVTTHYMDEAEYCERISIMANGAIKALGPPKDLKKEFDVNTVDEVFRMVARDSN